MYLNELHLYVTLDLGVRTTRSQGRCGVPKKAIHTRNTGASAPSISTLTSCGTSAPTWGTAVTRTPTLKERFSSHATSLRMTS